MPRRARRWTWRLIAFTAGTVLLLGVVGEIVTFATSSIVQGTSHGSAPRQK